jgi:adenylate cyclase class IV
MSEDESKDKIEEKTVEPVPELVAKHTEFETKYRVEPSGLVEFKRIMGTLPDLKESIYVESPDSYFTNEHITKAFADFASTLKDKDAEKLNEIVTDTIGRFPPFMRYRKPPDSLEGSRQELTTKYKRDGSKNNIQREEKNLRVDGTNADTVISFISDIGYKPNFEIWKACHIYNFNDATLVFYSVYDTTNGKTTKVDNFVEIEVDEETVSSMTEDQAWGIIEKYEKVLEPVGLSAKSRLRRSLFEMYRRELK